VAVQQHNVQVRNQDRHREMLNQDRLVKQRLRRNEAHRIEANRRMLRNGQNVDKLA
jgi:hypothetical protein